MKNNLPTNRKVKRELGKTIKGKNKALNILGNTIFFAAISSLVIFVLGIIFFLGYHNGEAAKFLNLSRTILVPMIHICTVITVLGMSAGIFSFITSFIKYSTLKDVM